MFYPRQSPKRGPCFTISLQELSEVFIDFILGITGTTLNTPFDVVKTRVQMQVAAPYKYNWAFPAIRTIIKEEGVKALYKGFTPKVLRLGPGGGILLVVFDAISGYIRKNVLVE